MEQIIIVEDDLALGRGLAQALRGPERQIVSCGDLAAARAQLACGGASLGLLDVNLPDGSGLDLVREVRADRPELPIVLLTANDMESDVVAGLEQGADDYITKPFSLAILRARVEAQLRRGRRSDAERCYAAGRYRFDFDRMVFSCGGRSVELSKTEQKLLRLLVANHGRTVPRAVLVDRIWTDGAEYVDENALSVAVKRLRDKLDAADRIRTVYGVGYRWEDPDD